MGNCCCRERLNESTEPALAPVAGPNEQPRTESITGSSQSPSWRRNPDDPLFLVMQTTGLTGQLSSGIGGNAVTPTSAMVRQVPAATFGSSGGGSGQSVGRRASADSSGHLRRKTSVQGTPGRPGSALLAPVHSLQPCHTSTSEESFRDKSCDEGKEGRQTGLRDDYEELVGNPLTIVQTTAPSSNQDQQQQALDSTVDIVAADRATEMMAHYYGISASELLASRSRPIPEYHVSLSPLLS